MRATGAAGHGSRFVAGTAVEKLMNMVRFGGPNTARHLMLSQHAHSSNCVGTSDSQV